MKPPEPGFSETMRPRIERLDARCHELGWHLDFLSPGWLTEELMPIFARMRCAFSLAHMGMFRAEAGPDQPGFRKLIDLLRHGDLPYLLSSTFSRLTTTSPEPVRRTRLTVPTYSGDPE